MSKLQLRMSVEDVGLIANALAVAQANAEPDQDVSDMSRVEAWLRYRLAKIRHNQPTAPVT